MFVESGKTKVSKFKKTEGMNLHIYTKYDDK